MPAEAATVNVLAAILPLACGDYLVIDYTKKEPDPMTPDALKALLRDVFDFAEEKFKGRPVFTVILNGVEFALLDTPLFDVLFSSLVSKGTIKPA